MSKSQDLRFKRGHSKLSARLQRKRTFLRVASTTATPLVHLAQRQRKESSQTQGSRLSVGQLGGSWLLVERWFAEVCRRLQVTGCFRSDALYRVQKLLQGFRVKIQTPTGSRVFSPARACLLPDLQCSEDKSTQCVPPFPPTSD